MLVVQRGRKLSVADGQCGGHGLKRPGAGAEMPEIALQRHDGRVDNRVADRLGLDAVEVNVA